MDRLENEIIMELKTTLKTHKWPRQNSAHFLRFQRFPCWQINNKSLRIFAFSDAGNVWRDGEKLDLTSLRVSAGLGLSWISPVGPLKLSWGSPLRYQPTDRIQKFQFQIGTAF